MSSFVKCQQSSALLTSVVSRKKALALIAVPLISTLVIQFQFSRRTGAQFFDAIRKQKKSLEISVLTEGVYEWSYDKRWFFIKSVHHFYFIFCLLFSSVLENSFLNKQIHCCLIWFVCIHVSFESLKQEKGSEDTPTWGRCFVVRKWLCASCSFNRRQHILRSLNSENLGLCNFAM